MSAKIVVYTAIFGGYDGLIPQPEFEDVDYICFSDRAVSCKPWQVIVVDSKFDDPVLDNRWYKILPHKHLEQYDKSIYLDGNYLLLQNPQVLFEEKIGEKAKMAFFDHNKCVDARDCIYKEHQAILELKERKGYYKDTPVAMQRMVDLLKKEDFPENNGLIVASVLLREHQDPEVIELMEDWWYFVSNYTKRDQLSFNYVLWKKKFTKFCILEGDIRKGNGWFHSLGRHRSNFRLKLLKFKLKRFLKLN